MIALDLNFYRKARIWLGEMPDLSFQAVEIIERTTEAKTQVITDPQRVALELFIPRGGHFLYGFLGSEFIPNSSGRLLVHVAVSHSMLREQVFDGSLAAGLDDVWVGLPREFAESILDGTSGAEEVIGSGTLHFRHTAYGIVGSAHIAFRWLSHIIVRLLASDPTSMSEEALAELIQFHLPK